MNKYWVCCYTGLCALSLAGAVLGLGKSGYVQGEGEGGSFNWENITSLELLDGEAFKRVVNPLVQMTANAYRFPGVISIEGWTLVDAIAPIHGGMHALLYKEDSNTGRMVLAFRGTDLTGSESSKADLCADSLLWGDSDLFNPDNCSEFSSDTLDYYKQAVDYTTKVLETYPDASLLLTGHSLGCGLAVLMTATFDADPLLPVIAFSGVGTKETLETRSLKLTADHDKKVYVISDKWDVVMRQTWKNQVGTFCLYETAQTKDCTSCFNEWIMSCSGASPKHPSSSLHWHDTNPFSIVMELTAQQPELQLIEDVEPVLMDFTSNCLKCFFETHYLKHVIDLVELGNKPLCESF